MARWASAFTGWTPTATADAPTDFTDSGHHTIQGGTTTQRMELREIYMGGLAGASAPTNMVAGRTSTVGATLTAGRFAALDPATAALGTNPTAYQISSTKPRRSTTLGMLLGLSFNAFGGLVRWFMGPDQVIASLGNATNAGEFSLNCFTGGVPGLLSSNITIETL